MKTKVTEQGLFIPKEWLMDVDEVEIRREQNVILILPVTAYDPIFDLGKYPVVTDEDDASENHDAYIYAP
jgi:hypothetical protein